MRGGSFLTSDGAGCSWKPFLRSLDHIEARHVQASAGNFSISIPLDRAASALLAISLNGTNLSVEHGAPVRLVLPGGECFTSIKCLDHLEVRSEPGENTAETISLARLSSSSDPRRSSG